MTVELLLSTGWAVDVIGQTVSEVLEIMQAHTSEYMIAFALPHDLHERPQVLHLKNGAIIGVFAKP